MAESTNIDSELIPAISTGFCGGISRTCGMCGAVSGGIMALGLCQGRKNPDESRDKCYTSVQKFLRMFEDRFGSTNCRELTGCDLGTKKGRREFNKRNMIEKCREFTEGATRMTMSIIEE